MMATGEIDKGVCKGGGLCFLMELVGFFRVVDDAWKKCCLGP